MWKQILAVWNLRNFAGNQFLRSSGSCNETWRRKKITIEICRFSASSSTEKGVKCNEDDSQMDSSRASEEYALTLGSETKFSFIHSVIYSFFRLFIHSFFLSFSFYFGISLFLPFENIPQIFQNLKFARFSCCKMFLQNPPPFILIHSHDSWNHLSCWFQGCLHLLLLSFVVCYPLFFFGLTLLFLQDEGKLTSWWFFKRPQLATEILIKVFLSQSIPAKLKRTAATSVSLYRE